MNKYRKRYLLSRLPVRGAHVCKERLSAVLLVQRLLFVGLLKHIDHVGD